MESKVAVQRTDMRFVPNRNRVLARYNDYGDLARAQRITDYVLSMDKTKVEQELKGIFERFSGRHSNVERIFKDNFNHISGKIQINRDLNLKDKLLIGSYFTMEYSVESAALFNPSIVPFEAYDLEEGEARFLLSFRAVGEGHVSSIVFRGGIINNAGKIIMDRSSKLIDIPLIKKRAHYQKEEFLLTLKEQGFSKLAKELMKELIDNFTPEELEEAINNMDLKSIGASESRRQNFVETIKWIGDSNYDVIFSENSEIVSRVIFPVSINERKGLEDARFVPFHSGDHRYIYYATYTAYSGNAFIPQLIETRDFRTFSVSTLHGNGCQNKGMALFPEKIDGKYVMLSRNDGENIFIMYSDNIKKWDDPQPILKPDSSWNIVQLGNCGSPIKTEYGWLVLTHGVGAVRTYAMGAILLDLNDPAKVIAKLTEPLIFPNEGERNGYVPNVIYSCGSLLHNGYLYTPYAMSDSISSFIRTELKELVEAMDSV